MSEVVSRPYAGVSDVPAMIALARAETVARFPGFSMLLPGDVVWQTWNRRDFEDIQLWERDGELLGYVDFEPPVTMVVQLHPSVDPAGPLLAEMLDWAEARARNESAGTPLAIAYEMLGPGTLSVPVLETDAVRIRVLEARGYSRVDRHSVRLRYSLQAPVPEPVLPPGMRVRHATDADADERMDLHQDAWSVWGPSSATVEAYRRLRAAPGYDAELDIVVEHEGRLVSYGIGWADAEAGIGIFEPTGTRPDYTGRGLMRAVLHEGMRRMKALGLHTAQIGTASVNDRAARAYTGAGFELLEREWYWSKKVE